MDRLGVGARLKMVENSADFMLAKTHFDQDPPPTVGKRWLERFQERHAECISVKQKALDLKRFVSH